MTAMVMMMTLTRLTVSSSERTTDTSNPKRASAFYRRAVITVNGLGISGRWRVSNG